MSIVAKIIPINRSMDGSRSFACPCGQASRFAPDAMTFAIECRACGCVLRLAEHCLVVIR